MSAFLGCFLVIGGDGGALSWIFECVVDDDGVSTGTGIFLGFLHHLNLADEDSEQFGRELRHFDILFCLGDKLIDVMLKTVGGTYGRLVFEKDGYNKMVDDYYEEFAKHI